MAYTYMYVYDVYIYIHIFIYVYLFVVPPGGPRLCECELCSFQCVKRGYIIYNSLADWATERQPEKILNP